MFVNMEQCRTYVLSVIILVSSITLGRVYSSDEDDLLSCIGRPPVYNHTDVNLVNEISHPQDPNRQVYLYETKKSLSWCESFAFCKSLGLRLAVAKERITQEWWGNLTLDTKPGHIWVAGRRKDFGPNWTWLSDDMAPCNVTEGFVCGTSDSDKKPYCRLTINGNTYDVTTGAEYLKDSICTTSGHITHGLLTWYQAMNECTEPEEGGRLAVFSELGRLNKSKLFDSKTRNYWIGVYYKPWLWIEGGIENASYQPVYYSSWKDGKGPDIGKECLAINGTGEWTPLPCEESLSRVICERFQSVSDDGTTPLGEVDESRPTSMYKDQIISTKSMPSDTTKSDMPTDDVLMGHELSRTTASPAEVKTTLLLRTGPNSQSSSVLRDIIIAGAVVICFIVIGVIIGIVICCLKRGQVPPQTPDIVLGERKTVLQARTAASSSCYLAEGGSDYSYIRQSKIYEEVKRKRPMLPPRDDTYNQAFEDTRLSKVESARSTMTETMRPPNLALLQTQDDDGRSLYCDAREPNQFRTLKFQFPEISKAVPSGQSQFKSQTLSDNLVNNEIQEAWPMANKGLLYGNFAGGTKTGIRRHST